VAARRTGGSWRDLAAQARREASSEATFLCPAPCPNSGVLTQTIASGRRGHTSDVEAGSGAGQSAASAKGCYDPPRGQTDAHS
jgi:hypothetical protein